MSNSKYIDDEIKVSRLSVMELRVTFVASFVSYGYAKIY